MPACSTTFVLPACSLGMWTSFYVLNWTTVCDFLFGAPRPCSAAVRISALSLPGPVPQSSFAAEARALLAAALRKRGQSLLNGPLLMSWMLPLTCLPPLKHTCPATLKSAGCIFFVDMVIGFHVGFIATYNSRCARAAGKGLFTTGRQPLGPSGCDWQLGSAGAVASAQAHANRFASTHLLLLTCINFSCPPLPSAASCW